jgi:transposase InsO family protein
MNPHDAAKLYAKRLVDLVDASSNKRAACRLLGIHHSTYYRWKQKLARTEEKTTAKVSWVEQHLQQRIVGVALAFPALGPQMLCDELEKLGVVVSPTKVWRTLRQHRVNTRQLRYDLLQAHRRPVDPVLVTPTKPKPPGRLEAEHPGDLVQIDCFYVGSFKETRLSASKNIRGKVWQYTAIDVASSWVWTELETSRHNPQTAVASKLAHRVAQDIQQWGHAWTAATTDNGNEFRSQLFADTLTGLGVEHRFIKAGRPQTNGKVERVQGTILEEFYQPTLIGYVEPSITGLRQDLNAYIHHYNWERKHRGKWNQGKTPAQIIQPKTRIRK